MMSVTKYRESQKGIENLGANTVLGLGLGI